MMDTIKVGIIGMGIRGELYADTLLQNPFACLAGFSDFRQDRLEEMEKKYEVKGYAQYTELIDNERLDAVIVATPDFAHREPFLYAARKELDIMVEKPFATSLEDAAEMVDWVHKKDIKCLVAFENRWNLPFAALKNYMGTHPIGDILAVNSILNDTIYVPTRMLSWAGRSTPGWFLLSHAVDMACWLKGKRVKRIYATGVKKKLAALGLDTYDSIHTQAVFEDDTHASFENCWVLPESMPMVYDFRFNVIAEKESFQINLQDQMVRTLGGVYSHMHTLGTPIDGKLTSAPSYMLHSFIDDIRLNRKPVSNEIAGYHNVVIVEAVHRSIEENQPIELVY